MKILNRRNGFLLPLLSVVLVLAGLAVSAEAAQLKDIRVGEYSGYTRLVFEFDAPMGAERITPENQGRLAISFADVSVDLVRKIPAESSRHIKDLQLWDEGNGLTVKLSFDLNRLKFKTFQLTGPPRFVVDVLPVSDTQPMQQTATPPAQPNDGTGHPAASPVESEVSGQIDTPPGQTPLPSNLGQGVSTAETPGKHYTPPSNQAEVTADGSHAKNNELSSQPPVPAKKTNRLLFYLLIGLVAVTIIILLLLLLMLLSRRHWAEGKAPGNVLASLKNQDEHIASLNTRIQEELKKYEEA